MLSGPKNYPDCKKCINGEYDPFQCEDCEDGSNFEPYDEDEESDDEVESIDYRDFIKIYREEMS